MYVFNCVKRLKNNVDVVSWTIVAILIVCLWVSFCIGTDMTAGANGEKVFFNYTYLRVLVYNGLSYLDL